MKFKFIFLLLLCAVVSVTFSACTQEVPPAKDVILQFVYDNSVTGYYCGTPPHSITTTNAEHAIIDANTNNVTYGAQNPAKAGIRIDIMANVSGGSVGYTYTNSLVISKSNDGKFHMSIPSTGTFQMSVEVSSECRTCVGKEVTNTTYQLPAREIWNNSSESSSYKNSDSIIVVHLKRMVLNATSCK